MGIENVEITRPQTIEIPESDIVTDISSRALVILTLARDQLGTLPILLNDLIESGRTASENLPEVMQDLKDATNMHSQLEAIANAHSFKLPDSEAVSSSDQFGQRYIDNRDRLIAAQKKLTQIQEAIDFGRTATLLTRIIKSQTLSISQMLSVWETGPTGIVSQITQTEFGSEQEGNRKYQERIGNAHKIILEIVNNRGYILTKDLTRELGDNGIPINIAYIALKTVGQSYPQIESGYCPNAYLLDGIKSDGVLWHLADKKLPDNIILFPGVSKGEYGKILRAAILRVIQFAGREVTANEIVEMFESVNGFKPTTSSIKGQLSYHDEENTPGLRIQRTHRRKRHSYSFIPQSENQEGVDPV